VSTKILHILHTNDIHSAFERMPQIAACLQSKRSEWEQQGEYVLTVDIGDHLDRSRIQTESSLGRVNVEILNRSGYQYVTIGNNEGLTLSKNHLHSLYDQAHFSVVLGNFIDSATNRMPEWAIPYAIHDFDGIRVCFLGVTAAFQQYYNLLGWTVKDPLQTVSEQIQFLRDQVDCIVVLSHLGYTLDIEMANQLTGIDVILGGHTHRVLEQGEQVGSVLVAQAGKLGNYVGHIRLTWDSESKTILRKEAELYQTNHFDVDETISQYVEAERLRAEQLLSKPIAVLAHQFDIAWDREMPFAAFLAGSIRKRMNTDIGLANAGLLLTSLCGEVSRKDLLECAPHPIKPCAVTLLGKHIRSILHRALQPEMVGKELQGFGFRGKVLGWMGIDGVKVKYSSEAGLDDLEIEVAGESLQLEREYTVGTVDMFLFNRLFPEFQSARDIRFSPQVLRELLAETIHDKELLADSFTPRWRKK